MFDQRGRTQQSLRAPVPLNVKPPPELFLYLPSSHLWLVLVETVHSKVHPVPAPPHQEHDPASLQQAHAPVPIAEPSVKPKVVASTEPPVAPKPVNPLRRSAPAKRLRHSESLPLARRNPQRATRFDGIYSKYLSS